MNSIDLAILALTIVSLAAIVAWAYVRTRKAQVRFARIEFGREQLQFGKDQHAFVVQQHQDMLAFRKEHMRAFGQGPGPMMGPNGPMGWGGQKGPKGGLDS